MASYEKGANGKWSVRFRAYEDNIEKQKRLSGFKTKRDAQQAYIDYMSTYISPKTKPIELTFNQLYALYKNHIHSRIKESSYITITKRLELHVLPYFGEYSIQNITVNTICDWQNQINQTALSSKYKNTIMTELKGVLAFGNKYHGLNNQSCDNVERFRSYEIKKEMSFWTKDEFVQFIKYVDNIVYRSFFIFLYFTGCRRGEAQALMWDDIDFNTNKVKINKTATIKSEKNGYNITSPKTQSSNRTILMPQVLVAALRELKDWKAKNLSKKQNAFVFGTDTPLPSESIRRNFHQYSELAGVKQIRIHDLRHSHASYLISQGCDIVTVSRRLGHSDVEQTLNTYSHVFPDKEREIVDKLNFELKI